MTGYKVTMVPQEHLEQLWPRIEHFMQRAADYTYGRYTVDDILKTVTDYGHTLWVAFNDKGFSGAVVTDFTDYPRKRYLDMVFVGGDDGLEWKDEMLVMLRRWAADNGCVGIESSGRLGWSKIFKDDGYKPLWQTYELPIDGMGLGA